MVCQQTPQIRHPETFPRSGKAEGSCGSSYAGTLRYSLQRSGKEPRKGSLLALLFSRRDQKFEADLVTTLAAGGKRLTGFQARLVRLAMVAVQHLIYSRLRNRLPRLVPVVARSGSHAPVLIAGER